MKNRKIQFRLQKFTDTSWCLQWRIDPQELGWFRRIFNFWKNVKVLNKMNKKEPYLFFCRTEAEKEHSLFKFNNDIKKNYKNELDLTKIRKNLL